MNTELAAYVKTELSKQKYRVFPIEFSGQKYIVKQQEARRSGLPDLILNTFTKIFGMTALRSIHIPGGKKTQDTEVKRLHQLASLGVPVPNVIHIDDNWLVLSHMGDYQFTEVLRNPPENTAEFYWELGLASILQIHQQGGYLSQCFVRNMIWHDNKVSFIDFEDDPAAVIGRDLAYARDWLLYLFSSVLHLKISPAEQAKVLKGFLQQENQAVQKGVLDCASKLNSLLRKLPRKRSALCGRDLISLSAFAACMDELRKVHSVSVV